MNIKKNELLELVKEALIDYEVFFDDIPVDEYITLDMLVSSIYEQFSKIDDKQREVVLLTSLCVLSYDNFVLSYKKHK